MQPRTRSRRKKVLNKKLIIIAAAAVLLVLGIVLAIIFSGLAAPKATTKTFKLIMNDTQNNVQNSYNLTTKETYVLDALLTQSLIVGSKTEDGYVIEKVDGVKADASKYQIWAIHVNNDLVNDQAANLEIKNGDIIELRLEYWQ